MSDKNINDADMGVGGIDKFNSETGKSEVIRPSELGDKPFTIDDYNAQLQAAQDKREQGENIMSEETQQVDTGEPVPENPGGIEIAFRPKTAVNIMRCQFPNEITTEINQHIEDTIIPNNVDHSEGLVGQIRQNKEKSAQLTFPHKGDEVGEMFGSVLERLAKEFVNRSMGEETECKTSIESMWTVHSYSGDYNPIHDHGTRTPMGVSCIMYLQVPRCIQTLGNPAEEFEGLNESSGAVDGFTYLTWGSNGMRDVNMMRPITEEYVKPEIGTLIMFPSWLRHGVMPFFGKEDDERRTFSANINVTLGEQEWV
mgnify:FL=1